MESPLRAAFEAAQYQVWFGTHADVLKVGARHPRVDRRLRSAGCRHRWHLITACNPRARPLTDIENAQRNRQLRDELAVLGLRLRNSVASDARGGWREPGFLVLDGDDDAIDALARRHGQLALLHGTPGNRAELRWL